jgi:cytochrome c-type biogenesis protein CcmH/NrfG
MRLLRTSLLPLACVAFLAATAAAGPLETGRTALAEKRWADAATAFDEALKATPGSKEALMGLTTAVAEGKLVDRYQPTQTALLAALKASPDDRDVRLSLAKLFSARAEQDNRFHADVEEQYRRLLKADPADEDAVVGTAQMYFARADHKRGLELLEGFLATKPTSARALRWKGEILYDQGVLAFRDAGKLDERSKGFFEGARAAFAASAGADPTSFDAWLKRGYAAQYLGLEPGAAARTEEAGTSYEKALELDPESNLPLLGLFAVFGHSWKDKVEKLVAAHKDAPRLQYWYADALHKNGKTKEAEAAVRRYLSLTKGNRAEGNALLAQVLIAKGDDAGAMKAFEDALKENPDLPAALEALDLRGRDAVTQAGSDPAKLKAAVAQYRAFLAKAPRYVFGRNNLGFMLRDAFGPEGTKSGGSRPRWILDESVKAYEEAVALIPEWQDDFRGTYPFALRYAYANVLNDTGLMYHYYPEVEDLAKAEKYYRAAQDWSQHGYWDAYTNLMKILVAKERWADAVEYSEACAEGLKDESGQPNESQRATAAGKAEELRKRLGKTEER